ncbi:BQ5605_C004g03016 [Microbotryum silenes-dioicae]|uniref:BQ5605_C004g03016 protein n=1 Tax=Microbotryum silenes-dioicae TaxID=796604 RepID=A0A2X0PBH1_9BASI|nr:BQ5605_C004g03016 [Microbotryum silenes-dioicae]
MGPQRYFDQGGDDISRPHHDGGSHRGGDRGRGGGGGRGARGSRGSRGRGGASSGSSRGGARGDGAHHEARPKTEPFQPKQGFIAAGLKAYADAAETTPDNDEQNSEQKAKISEGWKDKTTTQTTLYLTNLPATLTSPELSLIFSSYAPLRSAFVVSAATKNASGPGGAGPSSANAISTGAGRDRTGKATSRGFGYVRFVLRTDADKCLEEWGSKSGMPRSACSELESAEGLEKVDWDKLCGREGMKMSWAKKKLKEGEEPEGPKAKKEKKEKIAKPAATDDAEKSEEQEAELEQAPRWRPGVFDHAASRSVVVQGIPTEADLEKLRAAKAKKASEMDVDVEADAGADQDGDDNDEATTKVDDAEADDEDGDNAEESGKAVDWKKALKQKAKKSGDVEDVKWPVVLPSGDIAGESARGDEIIFRKANVDFLYAAIIVMYSPRHAHDVMKKLHNHVFRGLVVTAAVKSSWDLCQRQGRAKGGGRLVVRNLGFDITLADIRAAFARFGSLHSITLPEDPKTGKPRGFAFVYYVTKSCAEAALKAMNGTRIYAGMAADRIAEEGGKLGKKKEVREKKKAALKESRGGGGEKGRLVAVDWALSKDDWKKAQEAEVDEAEAGSDEDTEEHSDSDDDDSQEEEDDDSDLSPVEEDESDDEDEGEELELSDGDSDVDEEPQSTELEKGTTLFVRNMSFEATEPELYDLCKEFGPVRYARIVYDPTTKRSRGTAFVCFWKREDAQKMLEASESLNAGLFVGETSHKRNKGASQSLLMADPGTSEASKLTLHGRVLAAVAAVSKDDADKLREDRDKKGGAKSDRRNLYLMREGVIFPSWAIAQTLHPSDMAARQLSFDARKGLLRSNPSLYISRTRLSVRQVPLYVTDGMMKRLANFAIREFDKEVKAGLQKPLTADELDDSVVDASGSLPAPSKVERFKGVPPSRVRQAKILRQSDRVDPLTGLGRSKGYGFLEMGSHADALRVLRWANANKDIGALLRKWWRDALEAMIEKVQRGEGSVGKGAALKEKEERLKRLREKMSELVEEEELAAGKAARREAAGKTTGEGGRSTRCLIVEFSIENAVTVSIAISSPPDSETDILNVFAQTKRRAEKVARARERAKRSKDRDGSDDDGEDDSRDRGKSSPKKRRRQEDGDDSKPAKKGKKPAEEAEGEPEAKEGRTGLSIGAIIGKKRRQKK